MNTNVINNSTIFGIFYFFKGVKNILFYFLKIEKTFVNKKGANFEFMAKSQFLLNYIGYFSKK